MAFETPLHVKRLRFPSDRHLVNSTVTSRAADAFGDVDAVIEIGEVGQIVDTIPFQGRIGCQAGTYGPEQRRFHPQLRVTSHAGLGRGHPGEARFFDRSVAVTAIDAVITDMMFVAERHRLLQRYIDIRGVWRPENLVGRPAAAAN